MAQATALKTYDAVGNREDLTDIVSVISRNETPLFSGLEKTKATATTHEWQTDALSTGNDNAAVEGSDFSFAIPGMRTRLSNTTQIFSKTVEVSRTQQVVSTAGVEDEYAYQMEKRMKEIATDVEKALITGTGNSGASGTARRLKGILAFVTTNVETGTGTGTEALTEDMYNDLLQTIWTAGGRPDYTYVNGGQKRKISKWTSNNQRFVQMDEGGELKNSISVYESDFGKQRIELDPFMSTDKVLTMQRDLVKVAVLDPIHAVEVPSVAMAKRGAIFGELTIEVRNELGLGVVSQLS